MIRQGKVLLQKSRWLQIGVLIGTWSLCEKLARDLALPAPGGVIGMLLVLALLLSGRLDAACLRRGATSLLDHMVLFFVPAIMALLKHRELLGTVGLKILVVIVLSTLSVMLGTAFVVETFFYWRDRNDR